MSSFLYIQCSRKCNAGYKSRIVKCISSETGIFAPDYYCDSKQPIDKIACNRHPCPTWNTGDWSEVSKQFHRIILLCKQIKFLYIINI